MTIDEAVKLIEESTKRMDAAYGGVVFDEWLIVSAGDSIKILAHHSPRSEGLIEQFHSDAAGLQNEFAGKSHSIGEFGFTHEGHGSRFDAFVVLGDKLILLLNNIAETTTFLRKNPRWKVAQAEFVKLTDLIRSNPVKNVD